MFTKENSFTEISNLPKEKLVPNANQRNKKPITDIRSTPFTQPGVFTTRGNSVLPGLSLLLNM